jgi:hypothetical protein
MRISQDLALMAVGVLAVSGCSYILDFDDFRVRHDGGGTGLDADSPTDASPAVRDGSVGPDGGLDEVVVDAERGSISGAGTEEDPVATILAGIELAVTSVENEDPLDDIRIVRIRAGVYAETIAVSEGIDLVGEVNGDGDPLAAVIGADGGPALLAESIDVATRIAGLDLRSADAAVAGESSIAVVALDSPGLSLVSCMVTAARGANGRDGIPGAAGAEALPAQNGAPGGMGVSGPLGTPLARPEGGDGGEAAACDSSPGGRGGRGGLTDGGGEDGEPATTGGAGGPDDSRCVAYACGTPAVCYHEPGCACSGAECVACPCDLAGVDGAPGADGEVGAASAGGDGLGTRVGQTWRGAAGEDGGDGTAGSGGGGGGGGGGGSLASISHGPGGGGGGASGCPGRGGRGGEGGGASIGILIAGTPPALTGNRITSGPGGAGGDGGEGGRGREGGVGGAGRAFDTFATMDSGSGGRGGSGGDGNGGGGGGGGVSFGIIVETAEAVPDYAANNAIANSRLGGAGGTGAGTSQDGAPGEDGRVRVVSP